VAADTSGNTVTLTGHVRTWAEHDAVVDAAWMATGVYGARPLLSTRRWTSSGAGAAPEH
jgi:hypothetical protein